MHAELDGVPAEWLEQARQRQRLLVMGAGKNDTTALGLRLPGVKLACATVGMDKPEDRLERFNRQVREYVLQTSGVLLDTADIESWHGNEQALRDESPVRHGAYRLEPGQFSAENLGRQGAAMWWLLARLTGWEENTTLLPE